MAALQNRAGHYIFILFLSSFFLLFFSSRNLSGRRLDVHHTSTHGVASVRIQNSGLKYGARGSPQMQDPKSRQKSPSRHHRTTLSGHISATKACIDNRKKKLLSSNTFSTYPDNMVNFGPLTAEIGSGVWGTPTNFNGFCSVAALLHGIQQWASAKLCGVNRGRHLCSTGRPSRWALAHISSFILFLSSFFLLFFLA